MLWPVLKRSSWAASETSTPCFFEHVIDDRPADGEFLLAVACPCASAGPCGFELAGVGIAQHEAAAVGVDGAEDQFQDAVEQFVQVEDVADRLAGLVHDGQVGQGVLEPGGAPDPVCARMRLPSVSPMVLMMAEDSSTSARVIMLILSARSSPDRGRAVGPAADRPAWSGR